MTPRDTVQGSEGISADPRPNSGWTDQGVAAGGTDAGPGEGKVGMNGTVSQLLQEQLSVGPPPSAAGEAMSLSRQGHNKRKRVPESLIRKLARSNVRYFFPTSSPHHKRKLTQFIHILLCGGFALSLPFKTHMCAACTRRSMPYESKPISWCVHHPFARLERPSPGRPRFKKGLAP